MSNLAQRLTERLARALQVAWQERDGVRLGVESIDSLLFAIAGMPASVGGEILKELGIEFKQVCHLPNARRSKLENTENRRLFESAQGFLGFAAQLASEIGDWHVGTEHVIAAAAMTPTCTLAKAVASSGFGGSDVLASLQRYRPACGWYKMQRAWVEGNTTERTAAGAMFACGLVRMLCESPRKNDGDRRIESELRFHSGTAHSTNAATPATLQPSSRACICNPYVAGLFARLSAKCRVTEIHQFPIRSYAVGYTDAQLSSLLDIDIRSLCNTLQICQSFLGRQADISDVSLFLIGEEVEPASFPEWFADAQFMDRWKGKWFPQVRTAFIRLREDVVLGDVVTHELTHAIMDSISPGFQFPLFIQEGMAFAMEQLFHHSLVGRVPPVWPSQKFAALPPPKLTTPAMSMLELFCCTEPDRRLLELAHPALCFLGAIDHVNRQLAGYLERLIMIGSCDGKVNYEYTCKSLQTSADSLEDLFRAFCIDGKLVLTGRN